jgi:hypothetical protein
MGIRNGSVEAMLLTLDGVNIYLILVAYEGVNIYNVKCVKVCC